MLRQSQVVPRLRVCRVDRNGLVERVLGFVQLLQCQQRNAFVDGGLGQLWIFLEGFGKLNLPALEWPLFSTS